MLADKPLFVGSAVKTFMLGQYLKEVEAGRLSESTQLDVGPAIWSPGSPVFMHLQGTTAATSLLEAMIAHSDNTATDATLKAVGPDRVRQLIASLGYAHTRIPDSTRMLFSYLAGAPEGTDLGWDGMQKMATGSMPGKPRDPMNERQTMQSTATEMSGWYEHVLAGKLFRKPETLQEFKRISAMANAMPMIVPEDTPAYGKGGSIDWEDFHCFSVAGQMVQPGRRSSFSSWLATWNSAPAYCGIWCICLTSPVTILTFVGAAGVFCCATRWRSSASETISNWPMPKLRPLTRERKVFPLTSSCAWVVA